MPRRRLLAGLALVGSIAGALFLRQRGRRRDRVDLYFEDGSMISLDDGTSIVPIARRILDAAR
jgi:hypothetical protein